MSETPAIRESFIKGLEVVVEGSEGHPDASDPDTSKAPTLVDKSVWMEPVETKPAEIGPVETEPVETKPAETKPIEAKPIETKPAERKTVSWDGPDDPKNPVNWPASKKWIALSVNALIAVNVTYASVAPVVDTLRIARYFHKSTTVGYLITSMFIFGYVFGPIAWGPASELIGRRVVLLFAFILYLLTFIGQALAHNMETLLVMRFLGGVFGSAPLVVGGGIIADLWKISDAKVPSAIFITSVIIGPSIATIVGGFMTQKALSWRWPIWVAMIYSGVCLILHYFFLPETNPQIWLKWKAMELRKADPVGNKDMYAQIEQGDWTVIGVMRRTVMRPIEMVSKEKILVLVTLYLSFVYGLLYGLFEALPYVFVTKRNFSAEHFGLIYVAVAFGIILGGLIFAWLTWDTAELAKKWGGFPPPENQLTGAIIAGPLLVIGCFMLGWTGEYSHIKWYVPMLATIPIGCAVNLVFASLLSYLIDTYLMYAASAIAVTTVFRCAVGGAFPLFTATMFDKMGANWACTLLGLVSVILCPIPIVFQKYGAQIRRDSQFSPGFDLKFAARLKEKEMEATPDV